MEKETGKKFGDKENQLLVSVRSGARASMPGMMDTILNLGLNEEVVEVLAKKSNNPRWAWDCYRRFIQMYSDVVMEVGKKYFEELIDKMKEKKKVKQDVELTADDLKELANEFKAEYKDKIGKHSLTFLWYKSHFIIVESRSNLSFKTNANSWPFFDTEIIAIFIISHKLKKVKI